MHLQVSTKNTCSWQIKCTRVDRQGGTVGRRMDTCMTKAPAHGEAPGEAEDDLTLVHATKRGSVAAFDKIGRRYDSKLLRIAQNATHNREKAEDAVQEAFFKAYQRLDKFHENAKFSTWMIRIVLNEAVTKLR